MSDQIVNTSVVKDEALALLLHELLKKNAGKFLISGAELPPESDLAKALTAVAHELNTTVIKPASERAAAYVLRNHHKALYDALPVGDVDAFDMLKVVNEHLDKVSGAIRVLEASEAQTADQESK